TFTFSATDPSPADQQAGFSFFVSWGDGQSQTVKGQSPQTLDHVYKHKGTYTVSVTATDKDGGVSGSGSRAVTITAMGLQQDPTDSTRFALVVGGTDGEDFIAFERGHTAGQVVARMWTWSHFTVGTFTPTAGGARFTVTVDCETVEDFTVSAPAS